MKTLGNKVLLLCVHIGLLLKELTQTSNQNNDIVHGSQNPSSAWILKRVECLIRLALVAYAYLDHQ